MLKKIETEEAPKAIGPYSQAILAGDFLFVSGQLPIVPETGHLLKGDIGAMTHQVLDNIEAILRKEHLTLRDVVKMEVYLKDLAHFQEMNTIYAMRMNDHKPARHAFQVAKLPLDAAIEISCIAYKKA